MFMPTPLLTAGSIALSSLAEVDLFAVDRHDPLGEHRGGLGLRERAPVDDGVRLARVGAPEIRHALAQGREPLQRRARDHAELAALDVDLGPAELEPLVAREPELA